MSQIIDLEQSGEIQSVRECEGLQNAVSASVEAAPEATRVVSTIRHPGLTFSTRLVVGDIVSNTALEQMQERAPAQHDNLIWEANVPGSPNATRMDWRLLRAAGQDLQEWDFPLAVIPWFRPNSAAMQQAFDSLLGNSDQIARLAGSYESVTGMSANVAYARFAEIHALYHANYVVDSSMVPLSIASQRVYDELLGMVLGSEFKSQTPQRPFMMTAKDTVLPSLMSIGEAQFTGIVRARYPNGVKTLFYGYPQPDDAEDVVGYIGWSPKGMYVATLDRIADGKPRGKPKEIKWDQIMALVAQERVEPIGITPMVVMYPDPTIISHGADHGTREQMSAFIPCNCGMLREPHDSWAFLKVQMPDGTIAEPSLQELYLLFGRENPVVRKMLMLSLQQAAPVTVELDKLKNYQGNAA